MAIDPICGMTIEPATAAGHFDYEGATYHFCSVRCLERFRAAPDQYVKKASVAAAGMPGAGRRSLPMMQTMSDQPMVAGGERDPVCGMRVQPATAAGSHLYGGKTYYFCCQGCLERFRADPTRYLDPARSRPGNMGDMANRKITAVGITPIQNRRAMSFNSGFSSSSRVTVFASSAMPHLGQAPGSACTTSGCIGQT